MPDPVRRARGRRSVQRGKAFERAVARQINEALGARYQRNRLGLVQPFGDLIPDESKPAPDAAGVACSFEENLHIECKSNLTFSWATLLFGMHTILDEILDHADERAVGVAAKLRQAVCGCLVIFGRAGRVYVLMRRAAFDAFVVELTDAPALVSAGKIIMTLDNFLGIFSERGAER
jgi:hypothetical protein